MRARTDVLTGSWIDYSRGNYIYILKSDFWARWMTTVVAVALTLSAPYIFQIVRSVILQGSKSSPDSTAEERQELIEDPWRDDFQAAEGARDAARRMLSNKNNLSLSRLALIITILAALFVSFGAQVIAGAFSGNITVSRAARSASTTCGIWEFDDEDAGDEAAAHSDVYNYQREARAADYAQNCYNTEFSSDSIRCDFFYNSSIGFTTKSFDRCPFKLFDLCRDGLYSAVTFDTGLVDANIIGVNSKNAHKFRRKTTCSPLNMNSSYVNISSRGPNDTTYEYFYGSIFDEDGNKTKTHTYETSGNPFNWLAPVYSLATYATTLYPEYDYWRPIPALKPTSGSTLGIFFITSMHIYHIKQSLDPIFPSTTPVNFPGYRDPYYYNGDPRAQALACVDTTTLCSSDGTSCWSMTDPTPSNIRDVPSNEYWFLKWSLESSNVYDSIKWRLGSALLAQQKVSSSVSQPLSENHWESEAKHLFATSLARIQFDAWSIATAEGKNQPGFVDVTPDEGKGKLCKIWKFKSVGYTNISRAWFWGLLSVPFVTGILSIHVKRWRNRLLKCCPYGMTAKDDEESNKRWEELLLINLGLLHVAQLSSFLIKKVCLRCATERRTSSAST